uniref:Guanylate cyclase n=1 Tax=Taenia asiatica TaxID=60517 RepID=A0A0R3VYV4_TAEAS
LHESITFDWDFKLSLMTDLVRGMEYLHSTSLKAHGRLKSTNCVVNRRWVLKITDFGVPKICNLTEQLWTSPELLRDETAALIGTKPGDVYAFAIIMHEVFYLPVEDILKRVVARESIPPAYKDILARAWAENPNLRPTFGDLNGEIQQMTKGKKTNIVEHMSKMMEDYSCRLEEQVKTRTQELEIEKRKKDLPIQRMLLPFVAEALKAGVAVAPEGYDEVSIDNSDIVGFTRISAMSTPLQVVDLLNDLCTLFDKTIANYGVYKIETIGDAYMVASGLPVRNARRHTGVVATMALDLLSVCGTFTIKHLLEVPLRLHIGLHSGPRVAGVVGLTMPRYRLFGDTVNRTIKMESSGADWHDFPSLPPC